MASTYSPSLRIELIGTGDQSGLWGDTTNTNLGGLIEQAITGVQSIPMTDADYTLTALNGSVDEARNAVIVMTSIASLTATRNVFIPAQDKVYVFKNSTTGGQSIVVKASGGVGYTVPNGQTAIIYCDGTNCAPAITQTTSLTTTDLVTTNLTAANLNIGTGTTGTGNYVRATSPTLTTPTINGGTITGITDLAIVDGGTGASDANTARANLGLAIGTNVPSPTGSGASGTWGINVTGNAGTATNATNATNVVGSGNVACSAIQVTSANPTIWMYDTDQQDFAMHVNSNLWYVLNNGGAGVMYVDQSGNFTATGNVTAYSDERIKADWQPLAPDFLQSLSQVKSGTYSRTDLENKRQAGVSAQDVRSILPEVVEELVDDKLSLAYGNLAVVACVELAKRVLALEAEVKALKGE